MTRYWHPIWGVERRVIAIRRVVQAAKTGDRRAYDVANTGGRAVVVLELDAGGVRGGPFGLDTLASERHRLLIAAKSLLAEIVRQSLREQSREHRSRELVGIRGHVAHEHAESVAAQVARAQFLGMPPSA